MKTVATKANWTWRCRPSGGAKNRGELSVVKQSHLCWRNAIVRSYCTALKNLLEPRGDDNLRGWDDEEHVWCMYWRDGTSPEKVTSLILRKGRRETEFAGFSVRSCTQTFFRRIKSLSRLMIWGMRCEVLRLPLGFEFGTVIGDETVFPFVTPQNK